jgi:hypothetical protein
MTNKRFIVIDRQVGQASSLTRWSAVNPRYAVQDTETRKIVDEATTKRNAQGSADLFNSGVWTV